MARNPDKRRMQAKRALCAQAATAMPEASPVRGLEDLRNTDLRSPGTLPSEVARQSQRPITGRLGEMHPIVGILAVLFCVKFRWLG